MGEAVWDRQWSRGHHGSRSSLPRQALGTPTGAILLLLDGPAKDLCLKVRLQWHSIDLDASLTALWLHTFPFSPLWPCLFWENLIFSSILYTLERSHLHSFCDAVDLEGMDHEMISGVCTGDLYWANIHNTTYEYPLSTKLSFQGSDP